MYSPSPRRHRHRKRPRHANSSMTPAPTPVPTGMFWLPYGAASPVAPHHYMPQYSAMSHYENTVSSSNTTSDHAYSSDDADTDEDSRQSTKKMLTELRWIRQSTETLLTRQSDLERKLEQHFKAASSVSSTATVPQSKRSPSSQKSKQFFSSQMPSNSTSSPSTSAKAKTPITHRMKQRGDKNKATASQFTEAISKKSNSNKDPARKPNKVVKEHILRFIASQPGYGQNIEKAMKGYDQLIDIGRDEVTMIQKALGTPGVYSTTFGKEEVRPHRITARTNLERLALARVTPKINLSACPDSWAADYILRRVWEAGVAREKSNKKSAKKASQPEKKTQQSPSDDTSDDASDDDDEDENSGSSSEGDDGDDSTNHPKRVPEVRSAT